jgi:hypothetical protein
MHHKVMAVMIEVSRGWDSAALETYGLDGFLPFAAHSREKVPLARGSYRVSRLNSSPPRFIDENPAPARKGRSSSYPVGNLAANWVPNAEVFYIGKADLRSKIPGQWGRLSPFKRMAASHSGGTSIWQLADYAGLIVSWLKTPNEDPEVMERALILEFRHIHGRIPFANRTSGTVHAHACDNRGVE